MQVRSSTPVGWRSLLSERVSTLSPVLAREDCVHLRAGDATEFGRALGYRLCDKSLERTRGQRRGCRNARSIVECAWHQLGHRHHLVDVADLIGALCINRLAEEQQLHGDFVRYASGKSTDHTASKTNF